MAQSDTGWQGRAAPTMPICVGRLPILRHAPSVTMNALEPIPKNLPIKIEG
jgi:hypothetical protein